MTDSNEFQFFWSEGPLDWISQLCLRSFTRYTGVTVHLYSYDRDLNHDVSGCVCHDANEYLPREIYERVMSRSGGGPSAYLMAADLFRYRLLYEKGGWYFDTDCLLIKPLTPLFDRDYVFGWETATRLNNAVLKFPKGDMMLDQLYKEYAQKIPETPGAATLLFTQYLKKFNLIDRALPRDYFYAIYLWEQQQPSNPEESPYILHLYAHFDRTKSLDRRIESLERQIETLDKSLSLRIARKIPFGKEIRKVLVQE